MARLLFVIASIGMSGCLSLASGGGPRVAQTCSPDQAAALPQGARVELMHQWSESGLVSENRHVTKRVGTVLKSSPEGVALVNCVVEHRSSADNAVADRIPYLGRLYRNTGVGAETVPVVWVPLAEMGQVRVVEPPPADDVPLALEIDTAPRQPQFEGIGVDFDFANGDVSVSPVRVVEQVDTPTGKSYRRYTLPAGGENPGVQSLD